MAIITGVIIICNSCTKISEKTFVGTWKVLSIQRNDYDGEGWHEEDYASTNRTITFYSNGYFEDNDDGYLETGSWAYIESTEQLKFYGDLWNINRFENNELELGQSDSDMSLRIFMKKIQ